MMGDLSDRWWCWWCGGCEPSEISQVWKLGGIVPLCGLRSRAFKFGGGRKWGTTTECWSQ
ncbi:hypothetical protein LIA77_08643 [Sarocladium implicatum]|nr:hypothetical protein LIA77_08643 [Sarocladium implicatum]